MRFHCNSLLDQNVTIKGCNDYFSMKKILSSKHYLVLNEIIIVMNILLLKCELKH